LKLKVLRFKVTASSAVLGTVALEQSDFSTTPLSTLSIASSFPPSPELTTYLQPTLTVSNPPGGEGPLTVQALQLMILIGNNMLAFPPNNLNVNLQAPVPFGIQDATTATLQGFPATMNTME
jgi:hypothetical protein